MQKAGAASPGLRRARSLRHLGKRASAGTSDRWQAAHRSSLLERGAAWPIHRRLSGVLRGVAMLTTDAYFIDALPTVIAGSFLAVVAMASARYL